MNLKDLMIDNTWSLFLDRDGVINRRIVGGYVTKWEDFEFLKDVKKAVELFSGIFSRIFIVSNQQGIGKGLMTDEELHLIHDKMKKEISEAGGRIDSIYYCPALSDSRSFMRKPQVGMGIKAKRDFPGISFRRSVMAGDSAGDMRFGRRLGMKTVWIGDDIREINRNHKLIDFAFPDLIHFAEELKKIS